MTVNVLDKHMASAREGVHLQTTEIQADIIEP